MSDADLIYNACLQAEKRLEAMEKAAAPGTSALVRLSLLAIQTLREEIGNGLSREDR